MIRGRGASLAAHALGWTLLSASAAQAQPAGPKDKAVLRLAADALGKDYLETNFVKAEKKLQQAISICDRRGACSERVQARLHRDLAVVYLAGLGKMDAGKAELKSALELDPDLKLDPDYATPDLEKAFAALRKGKRRQEPPEKAEPEPAAVPEQAIGTPACEGEDCGRGGGEAPKSAERKRSNWFSLSIQQDLALVGAAADACAVGNQTVGYYSCFRASGSQYHGNPVLGDPADTVNGGVAPSTTRILVGYDRVLVAGLTLGARFGYVIRGMGPRADGGSTPLPFHVEGRIGYWFGSDAFTTATVRPFLFVAAGAAQIDSQLNVVVTEDPSQPAPPSQPLCPPGAAPVVCNPSQQRLAAWRRMGQGFAGGGGGLMVAFTPAFGMFLDVKYMRMFPTPGNAFAPELGLALGF